MDWDWSDSGEGAAAGAVVGSVVPGVGTVAGGAVGGVMGGMGLLGSEEVDDFKSPTLTPAQQFEQQYSGQYDATGTNFDAVGGADQTIATEKALGIQGFNGDAYKKALAGGLRANVNEGVRAERSATGNRMANSGFLNSGTAEALDRESIGRGERTYAMGMADIEQDSAGKQLSENAQRMGYSLNAANATTGANTDAAKMKLSNDQFTYNADLAAANLNNDATAANNAMYYGRALDQYQLNELDPAMREDSVDAGLLSSGTSIVGAGISAGGRVAGACRMAEATYGINHPLTNKARYRVNLIWPAWAKSLYMQHMVQGAALIKRSKVAKAIAKPIFWLIGIGSKEMQPNGEVR